MCLKYSTYQNDVFVDPRNYVDLCVDYCMLDFVLACVEFCRKNVKCDSVTRLVFTSFPICSLVKLTGPGPLIDMLKHF